MSLTRTKSGLRSLHRFFNTDVVVYCEGGSKAPKGLNASRLDTTLDVYYWSKVVEQLGIQKRFHFKSVGSKTSLQKIAEDAHAAGVTTITVCVDADYERQIAMQFSTPRTARSFGYSWENDVLSEETVLEVIQDMIGIGEDQNRALAEVRLQLDSLKASLSRWTEIDISLKRLSKGCVFDRDNPQACLDFDNHPKLRNYALAAKLVALGYIRRPRRFFEVTGEEVFKVCFGKLVSKNLYHYSMSIIASFGIPKLQYDIFMRSAIAATFRRFSDVWGGQLSAYHTAQRQAFL